MSRSYISGVQKDIDKWIRAYAEAYCNTAADQLAGTKKTDGMAKTVIEKYYYEKYDPEYYNRTEDLLNNSYIRYFKNNGRALWGGVRITSQNMRPYINSWKSGTFTPAKCVASWAWISGFHGYSNESPIITRPIPIDRLRTILHSEALHNICDAAATKKAKKLKYKYLNIEK